MEQYNQWDLGTFSQFILRTPDNINKPLIVQKKKKKIQ